MLTASSEMEDFGAAAMYFSRMAPVFAQDRWTRVEMMMLKMYAKCLKKVQRKDDYVATLLDILARSAAKQRASAMRLPSGQGMPVVRALEITTWLDDDEIETSGYLAELLASLSTKSVTVPMAEFFGDILVEPYIRHYDDKDGFQLRVQFRHLLEDPLPVDRVRVHLLSASANSGRDMWLDSTTQFDSKQGMVRRWLDSNVCCLN
jgi:trafficking protein particle complex subunit 10